MRIRLITVTHKSPSWVREGYNEYAKRLPPSCALELVEISAEKRTANADLQRITEREGEKILAAVKPGHHVIALDVKGKLWTTEELAGQMDDWRQQGRNIDLLVGGPDGLAPACIQKAAEKWSLSTLTFPHILVRVIVAEQLYRAWSILHQHPYHR
ncbi:23S rRNA (pseudouridine(1915)-N(3))-methyltransferase RlmH [Aquicella lusitana]|uniref:Ribosomal RNA large subunit methyltransferase H n=1 Tax=Aquicella lusitana TaxID=254246 RepID=A0A370GHX4_9COXI|nr:23S rRNA (pseudouridine(1915)-N(3))-methyltransferase RlmH [Aquicella lusitana]RDI42826.1 23S rRNA (pseudouridine-1915-N(3)-) methyltransferase [Aquicella lusitana]VVC73069.1 Ribosomal RNA large subunit methyltransferase H [Aquicella lusitana]